MDESRSNDNMRWLPVGISRRTALKGFGGTVSAGLAFRGRSLGIADQSGFGIFDFSASHGKPRNDTVAAKQELVNTAQFVDAGEYGAVGDGQTAASAALQAAIDEAGATKRPLWISPGTYLIDVGLLGVDNLTVFGYGATLRMADAGDYTPTLGLTQVDNIRLFGLTIDGNRDAFEAETEWKHALGLFAATNVTIEDCLLHNAKGDGLYLGAPDSSPRTPCQDIVVRSVRMEGNHRQGCSITGAQRAQFVACRFADTRGTPPEAGIDIEPDTGDVEVTDLDFWVCEFAGNASSGIKVLLDEAPIVSQGNIRFVGCTIRDNRYAGVDLSLATGVSFQVCDIHGNGRNGVEVGEVGSYIQDDITFAGGSISGNGQQGISLEAGGNTVTRFKALGVIIEDNGVSGEAVSHGIIISDGTFTDILIDGCTITGRNQRYGVHTTNDEHQTTIDRVRIVNNDLTGNQVAGARLNVATETQHVANNFGEII